MRANGVRESERPPARAEWIGYVVGLKSGAPGRGPPLPFCVGLSRTCVAGNLRCHSLYTRTGRYLILSGSAALAQGVRCVFMLVF